MKLCTIEADLSHIMLTQQNATGEGSFHSVHYDVILLFGKIEFNTQVAWKENVSGLHMLFNPKDF
jgi:hypothetical protein